jgi:superfamily II DNA/RNA helicase
MPPEIRRLGEAFLSNPKEIAVAPPASTAATVAQHLVYVAADQKREALRRLIRAEQVKNALIFCNRKRDVDILVKSLVRHGFNAAGLHGDMVQSYRMETLERFKQDQITFLVCSDVAARGLDISDLSHVFNFDVPIHAEDYVHRIGRTGRAGREGRAFTIATPADARYVAAIEKLIGKAIPVIRVEGLDVPPAQEGEEPRGRRPVARRQGQGRAKGDRRRERGEADQPRHARSDDAAIERSRARRDGTPDRERPRPNGTADNVERLSPPRRQRPAERPARDRHRRDDLGPAVVGFGDDLPAFLTRKAG